jgi:hypothetical protein
VVHLVFDRIWGPWGVCHRLAYRLTVRVVARLEGMPPRAGYSR